tara:strand:+ start:109 stop:579 length:471 start_codon:yes stop_codon:yes gene_type:complete
MRRPLIFITFIIACTLGMSANASEYLKITHATSRATFPNAPTGAVYMTIKNEGSKQTTLHETDVDGDIAAEAQIHTTEAQGDMMKMREVTEGITLMPGEEVVFNPGGRHIMLMGLKQALKVGQTFNVTLKFDDNQSVLVPVAVKDPEESMSHHHHH